jgi:hypothetical protein
MCLSVKRLVVADMCLSVWGLVVGSYVPIWFVVHGRQLCAFLVGG